MEANWIKELTWLLAKEQTQVVFMEVYRPTWQDGSGAKGAPAEVSHTGWEPLAYRTGPWFTNATETTVAAAAVSLLWLPLLEVAYEETCRPMVLDAVAALSGLLVNCTRDTPTAAAP